MSTALSRTLLDVLAQRTTCSQCRFRALRQALEAKRFSTSKIRSQSSESTVNLQKAWRREYFSANSYLQDLGRSTALRPNRDGFKDHISSAKSLPNANSTTLESSEPPHRRRKRLKALSSTQTPQSPTEDPSFLPANSASTVSDLSTRAPAHSLRRTLTACLALSKPRLSSLIILTTATAYSLYPVPAILAPAATSATLPTLSALTLTFLTAGTGLCAASANALNMLMEPEYDAQMSRTRNRPIVRGLIGKRGALVFAGIAGVVGVGGLYFGVNPTVAFLGAANIVLYAGVYTPMKRLSVLNTWVGALVGGIPPLMGWAAAAGQSAVGDGGWRELLLSEDSAGGWLLAGLLFAWQFPHFNSLSWAIRDEYKAAGYRMLVWVNGKANGRVALRYAILCFPICAGLWWVGVTDTGFLVTSSLVNGWMVREAWKFWRLGGQQCSARGLFWASVWHLPVVMVLAMIHKQGLWDGIWNKIKGTEEEDASAPQPRQTPIVYNKTPALTLGRDIIEQNR